ncbi:putative glycosyl hydrolase 43 family protein [Lyophyllum shimeji]|uniref:Glycosyl hydrolase 43 family protein n=1 Tax=Lyophyllum shimeji TaxID=47721 RepID=A0A9P3PFB9_LYOSH|nr:putative glycosyl hydrolase 43 family protein [Lyophyllum shimeji]
MPTISAAAIPIASSCWPCINELVAESGNEPPEEADRGGERAASNVEETADSGLRQAYTNTFTFTSSSPALDPSYFIRKPYKPFHPLTARRGYLQLFGNACAPGDRDSAALVLRKQTAYEETFEVLLGGFVPRDKLTEAGATVYYGDLLRNDIAVAGGRVEEGEEGSSRYVLTTVNCYELATKDAPVRFQIAGNSTSYTLGYAEGTASNFTSLATIDSAALSIAPAGGFFFKGTSFGIYKTGNGRPSLVSADFKYWKQTPKQPSFNTTSGDV